MAKAKMRIVRNRNGKQVVLLNPNGKGKKYAYDLRTGKDVTGGKAILKNLYAPIESAVKNMKDEVFENYNNYLTAHYEHLRKLELGFESKAPVMEDFGITDPKLRVESLEILHDLAVKLKDGKINEAEALSQYAKLIK